MVHRAKVDARKLTNASGTMVFQDAEQFRKMLFEKWRETHDAKALRAEREKAAKAYERERARAATERKRTNTLHKTGERDR